MGLGLDKPDRRSRQKVPDQKEGTPNHPGSRLVVMKVCLRVVKNLQFKAGVVLALNETFG